MSLLLQHNDPRSEAVLKTEIKQFEEMVFGSAPIAFRGSSFKVHWLKAPKTLMCSLVFPTPVYNGTKKSSVSTYPGSELFINGSSIYIPMNYPSLHLCCLKSNNATINLNLIKHVFLSSI